MKPLFARQYTSVIPIKNDGIIYVWINIFAYLWFQDNSINHVDNLRMQEH